MGARSRGLAVVRQILVELLAGPRARHDQPDGLRAIRRPLVDRLEAVPPRHPTGELEDADGAPHVEQLDAAVVVRRWVRQAGRLDEQSRGFVDRHEVSRHARIGDRHRLARLELT